MRKGAAAMRYVFPKIKILIRANEVYLIMYENEQSDWS